MSNQLNNQLGQALTNVGSALQQQELTEHNTLLGAKLSLYHAHGITSKAEGQLSEHQEQSKKSAKQNKIASIGVNATANVVVAAKAAVLDASTTTSNAASTATSVQKAASALTGLAGNIATTLAVANTLDKGSRIQNLVEKANKATNEAAKLAEEASLIALNLTIEASQSRAASVVTQSDSVKSKMTALQKSLSDTFGKQQELIVDDEATVNSAVADESEQAGIYKTARAEDQALRQSESFINQYINHNLRFTDQEDTENKGPVLPGDAFTLSFTPFEDKEAHVKTISEYRIIIVKADDAVAFNVESAKATLPSCYAFINPNQIGVQFKQPYVLLDVIHELNGDIDQTNLTALRIPDHPIPAVDYTGQPVQRGTPYKFFVYGVYTTTYQNEFNDTNGVLSLASDTFILQTPLPKVNATNVALAFYEKNGADCMRIVFKVPADSMKLSNGTDLNDLMEFRTFVINKNDAVADEQNKTIDQLTSKLFQSETAYRLTEETYQEAVLAYETAVSQGAKEDELKKLLTKVNSVKEGYQKAKKEYEKNRASLEKESQSKISDFVFDTDVAQTIAASNYSVAKYNPALLKELTTTAGIQEVYAEKINAVNASLKIEEDLKGELFAKINNAEAPYLTKINAKRKDIDANIANLKESLKLDIIIRSEEEAQTFRNNLSTYQTNDKDITIKIKSEDETESFEFEENVVDSKKTKKEIQWADQLIQDFKDVKKLETEIAGLADVNEWIKQQNDVETNIVLQNAKKSMLQDELASLAGEAKAASELSKALASGDSDSFDYYEVINTKGDFVDNFGEPPVDGDSYCVSVAAIIKNNEPEAALLFQPSLSGYSQAVPFDLIQI